MQLFNSKTGDSDQNVKTILNLTRLVCWTHKWGQHQAIKSKKLDTQ